MTLPNWLIQFLANILSPTSLQSFTTWLSHTYWQEWILPIMGIPFVLIFLVEWWYMHRQNRDGGFDALRSFFNFNLGGSYLVFDIAMQMLIIVPFCLWLYQFRLYTVPINLWTVLPIFVGVEFCYYWFHRASHRINWFWSAHIVHHSDDRMNLSTAMRQSVLYTVTGWWLFFLPIVLFGVHPVWVFFFYSLNLLYQYFIHTEVVGKLPAWAEYIFDTPSNHRAHHGTNPQYIDKNYGGVLIIFDRIFGTYVVEDEPVIYGAVGQPATNSFWQTVFSQFVAMWQMVWSSKSLRPLWIAPEKMDELLPEPKIVTKTTM